ncbi:NPC intracellular cholesterol transporter 2 homolog a-like [Zerene cesonia]|uniref:NPC intracellular cholesterol transporter 2 homolog a-like n=1 Tax=Zerene cesonia TaxID=33412 RepID=UPI0018E5942B|nr:NPC intracellular cholesterol transporter 2 homolog a-like [Zerene cesonia]
MKNFIFLIVIAVVHINDVLSAVNPLVAQCKGRSFDNLQERIQISACQSAKSRCKLRKGTDVHVTFKFKPTTTVKTLKNEVYADIAGVPLPFIGVTGRDACQSVVRADDGSPARCPLEANVEYVYTNIFPVESYYPEVTLRVHWALIDGSRDVICFEVPAAISPASKKG